MTHTAPRLITEHLPNSIAFDLCLIEGGEYRMGGFDGEASDDEKPVHRVNISTFYLGKYPVTQAVWQAVMGDTPSYFKGETARWSRCRGKMFKISSKNSTT